MQFRTPVPIEPSANKISLGHRFISLGSCFATEISTKLESHKFTSLANPAGTLFDPLSIARLIDMALDHQLPDNHSYVKEGENFVNLFAHSTLNAPTLSKAKATFENVINHVNTQLKKANWLFITLGTSWSYTHKLTGIKVANCHKIPQKEFDKTLLTFEETQPIYHALLKKLLVFNPNLKIIITVSPVRHIKDSLPLNNLSKSHLFLLAHSLANNIKQASYYPAYEIVVDELRDYRFYKTDMIHPTQQAVDYIWKHFTATYFDKEAFVFINKWEMILKALRHKPFNPTSKAHQQFLRNTLTQLKTINGQVNVKKEINLLEYQIAKF